MEICAMLYYFFSDIST